MVAVAILTRPPCARDVRFAQSHPTSHRRAARRLPKEHRFIDGPSKLAHSLFSMEVDGASGDLRGVHGLAVRSPFSPTQPLAREDAPFAQGDGEHCPKFRSDEVRDGTSCGAKQRAWPCGFTPRWSGGNHHLHVLFWCARWASTGDQQPLSPFFCGAKQRRGHAVIHRRSSRRPSTSVLPLSFF